MIKSVPFKQLLVVASAVAVFAAACKKEVAALPDEPDDSLSALSVAVTEPEAVAGELICEV